MPMSVTKAMTLDTVTGKNEKSLQKQNTKLPQRIFQRKETNYVVIIGNIFLMTLDF